MKHIIIGTAGHIDHGKTALIKRITSRDTDTLKEEKERGISINLGFTYFDLPSKRRAGIIDVPGHEKFIKNMLAGASSIDIVLFVIAADEGIMPQTIEHFQILELLKVKKSIIVITKIDMVDEQWLLMVEEEIKKYFKDTTFKDSKFVRVSSKTGEGIKDLINVIDEVTEETEEKDKNTEFFMPIDRVFTVPGFGTVVTGTIMSGEVCKEKEITLYPSNILTKVRGIQVHEESVDKAYGGQRCAINLVNIKVSDIKRGFILSSPSTLLNTYVIDCKILYLKDNSNPLKNNSRLKLYYQTSEVLCRVRLFKKEELEPGEEDYVQLILEEGIVARKNDRFVIRSYSPMHTIGGGYIVEANGKKAGSNSKEYLKELNIKDKGDEVDKLESFIKNNSLNNLTLSILEKKMNLNGEELNKNIEKLLEKGKIYKTGEHFYHYSFVEGKEGEIKKLLEKYHKDNPIIQGISKEEFRSKIFNNFSKKELDNILNIYIIKGIIIIRSSFIALFNFKMEYSKEQSNIKEKILEQFIENQYSPLDINELKKNFKEKEINSVISNLIREEILMKLPEDVIILRESYNRAKEIGINYLKENRIITPTIFRTQLNTNRKVAVGILMKLDEEKITKREEEGRILI